MKLSEFIADTCAKYGADENATTDVSVAITARLHECVKALMWEMSASNAWDSGHYSIVLKRTTFSVAYWAGRPCGLIIIGKFQTFKAAKAAAQSHYAAQIIEGLDL